jgi:catechol 2,3-dioxygenase-like lactoylglutathione lyase family enzyme
MVTTRPSQPSTRTGTRLHVSLDTPDLARSVAFLRILLDAEPFLERADYARFSTSEPGLVLGLNAVGRPRPDGGALQHLGLAFPDAAALEAARARLDAAGLAHQDEEDVVCCYGRLSRLWATDAATGVRWELFVPHAERVEAPDRGQTAACCAR